LTELQCRRFLTVFCDGRLHHSLDAVAAQTAVMADAFDIQQTPIDLPPQFLRIRQVGQTLVDSKIVRVPKRAFGPAAAPFFEVLLQATANHVFLAGHRMMVQVQSSWFPLYDRNPQTFVPTIFWAKPEDYRKATQRVYHAQGQASFVELPVVAR
jgi:hypothetical protein